jgi:hypothetical protein
VSTTHVVGPQVVFGKLDRAIQRCAICGEKLDDYRPSRIAIVGTSGAPSGLPSFGEGRLLRVSDGNPKSFVDVGDFVNDPLPDDFCLSLVEQESP